ncbi:MAG: Na/Pi symporter [Planctomycetota bacterium]|nr:Na/Pi symporter [Planctomycetota bacterium]
MATTLPQLAGGLGLFLLGMITMTSGLKTLAGPALRRILTRFTRSPATGAATGAVTTALIQSSSATTVAAIGFVSAGLLSFPQALGVIFGANLGTTITGWLVALVGFKLKLGLLVLPLILLGALGKLLGSRRVASAGMALAGFGLIFVGIGMLQGAMSGMADLISPSSFPPDTWGGRFLLVLLGIGITLLTQSSSAGIAIALVAVNAGTISFNQAAALVIGMDVGTTATAALATIGASTQARRTGFAHVIYNCMTAVGAFFLLPLYAWALASISDGDLPAGEAELALVGFHTLFNGLGVIAILPFTGRFATWLEHIIPDRGEPLTRGLDPVLLQQPEVAVEASAEAIRREARKTLQEFAAVLEQGPDGERADARVAELAAALHATRAYLAQIRVGEGQERGRVRQLAMYHAVDHLRRLLDRCRDEDPARVAHETERLSAQRAQLTALLQAALRWMRATEAPCPEAALGAFWRGLYDAREPFRRRVLASFASGDIKSPQSLVELDAARWLERSAYHTWRVVHHLKRILDPQSIEPDELPEYLEHVGPEA